MKYMLIVIFNLLTGTASAEFCFLTFNAYGPAYSLKLKKRTQLLAKLIEDESQCGVLTFQEVWRESHVRSLQSGLKKAYSKLDFYRGDELLGDTKTGLMTSSFFPISEANTKLYRVYSNGPADWLREQVGVRKAFSKMLVEITDNGIQTPMEVINTHLHHSSQAIRLAQLVELAEYIRNSSWQGFPLIISGDFNAQPYSLEWEFINKVVGAKDSHLLLRGRYTEKDCTYCNDNPLGWGGSSRVLDYIFIRNGHNVTMQVKTSDIFPTKYDGQYLSDHYGRRVRLSLQYQTHQIEQVSNTSSQAVAVLEKVLQIFESQNSLEYKYVMALVENKLRDFGEIRRKNVALCEDSLLTCF